MRVGGAGIGRATRSLVINGNDVIGDHSWVWRADHGSGVGWTSNTADAGLVVNGANVTYYGLFVEHYQRYQVIWNGNGGRHTFFQNVMPYDVPDQGSWMNGSTRGYAAHEVGNRVTSHEAWGLGSCCYFSTNPSVVAERAFEVPVTTGSGPTARPRCASAAPGRSTTSSTTRPARRTRRPPWATWSAARE